MKSTLGRPAIWALRALLLAAVLGGWELASGRLFEEFFVSRPSAIGAVAWSWVKSGRLFYHAGITITEAVAGFALGGLAGMTAGILLGRLQLLADVLDPFITMFYSLPKIALAPLFVLWFGIGMDMKIILTATVVFFLVFLNTYTGVRNVSRELIAILRLMGANERHVLTKVVLPSAVTWVFAGLRLSVPYALIGAIVGELIAANQGLGYLLADAAGQFNTAGVFAALLAIVLLALCLNLAVKLFEYRAMPWQRGQAVREMSI
ncbi:NitT/TauT family transport system permease protein [Stella humosa]|uniref:NitT/TauT family transport system permease protein n=1 Tax=Stella humosa TaxID=94 RepID=A0A3N1MBM3_9PROT|nr:ABC transporter permease [Stella humosa]ROQ00150.1 NitT/TauT family transport system permease protein [Stella humosa]BBK30616.1 ABC transporter permease [Stella humosa]